MPVVPSHAPRSLRVCLRTLLKQETTVEINGIPMTSYLEGVVESVCTCNAQKVRERLSVLARSHALIDVQCFSAQLCHFHLFSDE